MTSTKYLIPVLFPSLALNIFLAGVFVGGGGDDGTSDRRGFGRPGPAFSVRSIEPYLSEDQKATVRQHLMDQRPLLRAEAMKRRDLRMALRDELLADEINEEMVVGLMFQITDVEMRFKAEGMRAILKVLPTLEPEERRQVVRSLLKRRHRGQFGGKHRGHQGPGPDLPPPQNSDTYRQAPDGPPPGS